MLIVSMTLLTHLPYFELQQCAEQGSISLIIIKIESSAMERPSIYVVMGVSGCGKSTLGQNLADSLNATFYEGDDFHSKDNVAKMSAGRPLNDEDRLPWLRSLRKIIENHLINGETAVLSCSALKRSFRDILGRESQIYYLCLQTDQTTLKSRLINRADHFMPSILITSQLQTLELPDQHEQALILDANLPLPTLLAQIQAQRFSTTPEHCK